MAHDGMVMGVMGCVPVHHHWCTGYARDNYARAQSARVLSFARLMNHVITEYAHVLMHVHKVHVSCYEARLCTQITGYPRDLLLWCMDARALE